ncbi:hypothetical protein EW145_g3305 [Phellinidium pouzarii]|uniref:WW domain-containing protein n=1 Tax=Phellinidium pouzarii TaxID=167371 RepID=A0A4S4L929_9AGAM|nr:hypothetical protein EW145_g3305 [Phellinidium pouzarii]
MADDAEVLDWGGEDDEHYEYRTTNMGDGDDVVSIGGEEDDMMELAAFHSRSLRDNGNEDSPDDVARPLSAESGKATPRLDDSRPQLEQKSPGTKSLYDSSATRGASHRRSQSQSRSLKAPLMHALPPKPAVAPAPSYRDRTQSNPGFIAASVMSSSRRVQEKDDSRRRTNGTSKLPASDVLPSHWVIRHSTGKGGEKGEIYYYNIRTDVSQWERPSDDDHIGKTSPPNSRETDRLEFPDNHLDSKMARNRSSGDVRSDRQSDSQLTKGRDRPTSPAHDLSYDDRHYRPANGGGTSPSRTVQRSRLESPPINVQNQNHHRDDAFNESAVSQNRMYPRRDSFPSRAFDQQLITDELRPRHNSFSGQSDRLDFSREPPQDGGPMRAPHGPGPDRGRGMRRNIGPMQDERLRPQRDAPVSRDSYSRVSTDRPAFQQGGPVQRQAWHPPSHTRRDIEAPPMNFDPPRRPREPEYTTKTGMGVDAKRRRVDERTADSAHMRRDRSPSPMSNHGQSFPPVLYPSGRDGPQSQRGSNDNFRQPRHPPSSLPSNYPGGLQEGNSFTSRSMPSVDRPHEGNIDGRSVNSGPNIPSGPRIRNHQPAVEPEYREPIDFGRRQQPPVGPSTYNQQHGRQNRPEDRRFDSDRPMNRSGMDHGSEIMDVDFPPRSKGAGPLQTGGSMYSDRMLEIDRRNSMDRPPTAPRAMHSKGSMPTSPIVNMPTLPSQGNFAPPGAPTFGEDSSPPGGPRGRRQTRFGWRQRPSEDRAAEPSNGWPARDVSLGRDAASDQIGRRVSSATTQEEPPRHDRLPAPPSNLSRVPKDGPFTRRIPSPKLTGANNVPVPPRKGWQTGPDVIDRTRFDYHPEPNWEEPNRARRADSSLDRSSRITPPEERFKSLHGDVQRRMSLNDRSNVADQEHPAYNLSHGLDSEQSTRHSRLPEHNHSSARRSANRISRFSKPEEGAGIIIEPPRAPREWIPREKVTNAYGGSQPLVVDRDDRRAHSPPPLSAETVRSMPNPSSSDSMVRQGHSAFSTTRTPQERSPREDRRTSIPPSTAYESPQSRSDDLRKVHHNSVRISQYSPRRLSRTIPPSPPSITRPLASRLDGPSVIPQNTRGNSGRKLGNQDMTARDDRSVNNSASNNSESAPLSRLPTIASSILEKSDKAASQPNTPMEEPRMSQSPAFRIKRPHSKFADAPQQRNTANANESIRSFDFGTPEIRPLPRNDVQERPIQLRSNSLLERLNMTTEAEITSSPQPSLRDRVEPPLAWKNNDLDNFDEASSNTNNAEEAYVAGYGEGRGRGQGQVRGRGRGGRPRRGRGRGGFGAIDS